MAADIAFAVDSIPAAFAITRDSVLIWMGNVFALLGLRALFVLVEGLIRRFRYLDETIAVVLALVAVKLLIEDIYKIGPVGSLAIVAAAFAVGITASIIADRRDPDADAKREERGQRTSRSDDGGSQAARPRRPSPRRRRAAPERPACRARRRSSATASAVRANGSAATRPSATDIAATARPSAKATRTAPVERARSRRGRRRHATAPASAAVAGGGRGRRGRRSWAQCRPRVRSGPATFSARDL